MSDLKTNLQNILEDKNTNLLPENLKKGVKCLGIIGIAEISIDTYSDNPIMSNDVIEGKEGFVNGEKIIGTLDLSNLLPENIKAGVTINGIEGTYTGEPEVVSKEVDN